MYYVAKGSAVDPDATEAEGAICVTAQIQKVNLADATVSVTLDPTTAAYTGSAITPTVFGITVNSTLTPSVGTDVELVYYDNTNTEIPSMVYPGTYKVSIKAVSGSANYEGTAGIGSTTFTIEAPTPAKVYVNPTVIEKGWGNPDPGATYGSVTTSMFYVASPATLPAGVTPEKLAECLQVVRVTGSEGEAVGSYKYRFNADVTKNADVQTAVETIVVSANGDLNINKGILTVADDPAAVTGDLKFTWDAVKGEAVPQALITAGTLTQPEYGTYMYSIDGTTFSEEIPSPSDAGNYHVYWYVKGDANHEDIGSETSPAGPVDKSIAKITPTLTNATAATSLVYPGDAADPLQLLATAGSASDGAPVYYQVKYRATETDPWGAVSSKTKTADVVGKNAGQYSVKPYVPGEPDTKNYNANYSATEVIATIAKAAAFTAEPTLAFTEKDYNATDQALVVAGTGTVEGKVKYRIGTSGAGSTDIPTRKWAGDYTVQFSVDDPNYEAVAWKNVGTGTATITKPLVTVKLNDATKVYTAKKTDIETTPGLVTPADGKPQIEILNKMYGDDKSKLGTLNYYIDIDAAHGSGKHVGTWEKFLTVSTTELDAFIGGPAYEWVIMPGTLIITPATLTITANTGLTAECGVAFDIHDQFTYSGFQTPSSGTEDENTVFSTKPILTQDGGDTPDVGTYNLSFTEGVQNKHADAQDFDYKVVYAIPTSAKFTVTASTTGKIVVTVVNKKYQYGDDIDVATMVAGTDYYVTGFKGDDNIENVFATAPTFTTTATDTKTLGTFELNAAGAVLTNPGRYGGGVQYVQGELVVAPRLLTVTIDPQTVAKGTKTEDDAFDKTAWSVTGLQFEDKVEDLGGELTLTPSPAETSSDAGIKLTLTGAKKEFYTFDAASWSLEKYGALIVLDGAAITLEDGTAKSVIAAADGKKYDVTIKGRKLNQKTWNVFVLPFEVDPFDFMAATGGNTAVFNVLESIETADVTSVKFGATIDPIPANTPFLVKPQQAFDGDIVFTGAEIVAPAGDPVQVETAGKFIGTYETREVGETEFYALQGGSFKKFEVPTVKIGAFRAYITLDSSAPARFFVEEEDGTITAIDGLEFNNIIAEKNAEGWYTVNGVKLNAAPTQKGTYIKDGKKVFVK